MSALDVGLFDAILESFLAVLQGGFLRLEPDARRLLSLLATIELSLAAMFWLFATDEALVRFLRLILKIGFFVFLVLNFEGLTTVIAESFITAGLKAGGSQMTLAAFKSPSTVVHLGLSVSRPFFAFMLEETTFLGVLLHLPALALMGVAALLIYLAFLLIGLHIMLALIEFHLLAALGLILVPFGVMTHTAFLAEGLFGWVASSGIRLMVLAAVMSLIVPLAEAIAVPSDPTLVQALVVLGVSFLYAILAWSVPNIAAGLFSGGPALSGSAVIGSAVVGAYSVRAVSHLGGRVLRGSATLINRLRRRET